MVNMKKSAVFMCVLLVGCIFQGSKLQFEEVAKGESSYQGSDPLLFVVTSYEDTLDFVQYTGYEEELKRIDYDTYVVVCVLLGVNPKLCDIEVHELIREEDAIVLLTTFLEPVEKPPAAECYVSPFHIIKVQRSDIGIKGEVSFLLQDTKGFLHAKVVVET